MTIKVMTIEFLILVVLLSLGCASNSDYQTVVEEREQLKQQLTLTAQERDGFQSKLIVLELVLELVLDNEKKECNEFQSKLIAIESIMVDSAKVRTEFQTALSMTQIALVDVTSERDKLRLDLSNVNGKIAALQTTLMNVQSGWRNTDQALVHSQAEVASWKICAIKPTVCTNEQRKLIPKAVDDLFPYAYQK